VRELLREMGIQEKRWAADALLAIQDTSEAFLTSEFEAASVCVAHRKCVTLMPKDLRLAMQLRGDDKYLPKE